VSSAAVAFGRRLRDAREQKGVTLDAVAESTKINIALLASLERGDVSRWPRGIFRRAFLREYASAIGLQPAPVLSEFVRLFPEDGESHASAADGRGIDGELRLTLAVEDRVLNRAVLLRLAAAAIDVAVLIPFGALLAYFISAGVWLTIGVAGLTYYTLATAWLGQSAASWWLNAQRVAMKDARRAAVPRTIAADRFQIVSRRQGTVLRGPSPIESTLESAEDVPPAAAASR
jgi:transcriptional regulator with XRE-family HTH domain